MNRADHPALGKMQKYAEAEVCRQKRLDTVWLNRMFLVAGADDVRFIVTGGAMGDDQREDTLRVLGRPRRLINLEIPMNFQFIEASQERHR